MSFQALTSQTCVMEVPASYVFEAMVLKSQYPHARTARLPGQQSATIGLGAFLDRSAFPWDLEPWDTDRIITKARCYALAERLRERQRATRVPAPVISGEAAMIVAGVPSWNSAPTIVYRDESSTKRLSPFPAVQLGSHRVSAAEVTNLGVAPPGILQNTVEFHGIRLASTLATIVDLAKTLPMHQAYANVCTIFGVETGFDNFHLDQSHSREADLRRDLLEQIEQLPRFPGVRRTKALIAHADAATGSVLEAMFIWLLRCNLKRSVAWETQHHVFLDGNNYFCDAAIPSAKLSLEFHGIAKFGSDPATVKSQITRFLDRVQAFQNNGWTTRAMTARDVRHPMIATALLRERLEPFRVLRPAPGGPLWEGDWGR